jgi:aminobenzoyl-glutamate transport protein
MPNLNFNGINQRFLNAIERAGNKLPDPAVLFIALLFIVWVLSWLLSNFTFGAVDPRTGDAVVVVNQLSGSSLTTFFASMVKTFAHFHPIGVVLVAMLGIGVAEHTGFISASLRATMEITSQRLLTPMVILVGIMSHTAADAGYVLVIPLGGALFYAAGRHPLAGIAAAFAGVSGGFSANFVPSAIDPMLQGISQSAAQILDPNTLLNPLNNFFFTASSSVLIVALGWIITDKIVEPRLQAQQDIDADLTDLPTLEPLTKQERKGLRAALWAMLLAILVLAVTAWPDTSSWRGPGGSLTESGAPLMASIVSLIFVLFLIPGIIYGVVAGTVKSSKDIIDGMTKAMTGMAYYLVIMFFIAQFIFSFSQSNLGILLAVEGAEFLKAAALPQTLTITGIVFITATLNLFVGSASAGTDFRTHAHGTGNIARSYPGGLSRGRFNHQHNHTAYALFSASGCLLPALYQGLRDWYGSRIDGPLFHHLYFLLDCVSSRLLGPWDTAGIAVKLCIPVDAAPKFPLSHSGSDDAYDRNIYFL